MMDSMYTYIDDLTARAESLSLEDDDYEHNMLEIATLFKGFGEALKLFLQKYGFCDTSNDDQLLTIIRDRFKSHDIKVPRGLNSLFEEGKKIDRKTAYQFCFAFDLSLDQTNEFFTTVMFERGIDCHVIEEAVFYFALKNHYSYQQALGWLERIPSVGKTISIPNRNVLYTKSIHDYIATITQPEQLIQYIGDHINDFSYNNATAISFIQQLWADIVGDSGLAAKEGRLIKQNQIDEEISDGYDKVHMDKQINPDDPVVVDHSASTWTIFAQIIGLDNYQESFLSRRYDRSLSPILQKNVLMPLNAAYCFPNQHSIDRLFRGEIASNELIRKMLIFLVFYTYWVKKIIGARSEDYRANHKDSERCQYTINKYLTDAGYAELYAGNPYDWLFKWALNDSYPLMAFRYYMGEVFAQRPIQTQ